MAYPNCQMWRKTDVANLIKMTIPPGEKEQGFDDGMLFIDSLSLAIALKEKGKLLLEELRKKWPAEVESSMAEAEKLASQQN